MKIAVPKEIKNNENRVGLVPSGVNQLVLDGHEVYIQKGAGLGIGITDEMYTEAGAKILVEERLEGVEASVFALCNGKHFILIGSAQDHKRAFENDKGPNTGGMGAISPAPSLNNQILDKIVKNVFRPTIDGMNKENIPYEGVLYAGIMITKSGPKLIEFNCRLGDPEAQVILPRFKFDFLNLILSIMNNKKIDKNIKLHSRETAITVVMASKGYPGHFEKGFVLPDLKKYNKDEKITIFHSGTKLSNSKIISDGGRILSVTALGDNLKDCRKKVYRVLDSMNWPHGFFRRDIGKIMD